ncbi:hypothetical protein HDU86_000019 [Geranomyces michiganensis]|nr:hypothetical protein HDU86_000019 [Geranomyces michiganensis]
MSFLSRLSLRGIDDDDDNRGEKTVLPMAAPKAYTLPAPPAPNAAQYEQVRQHAFAQLVQALEGAQAREDITIGLTSGDSSSTSSLSSSSFAKRTNRYTLSLAEQFALLADIRHEVSQKGWRIVSCSMCGTFVRLAVQPANDRVSIPGGTDFWPQIQTSAQLMDVAVQDLIRAIAEAIMAEGPKLDFSINPLPVSCRALAKKPLLVVIAHVRQQVGEKWAVEKCELEGDGLKCILKWQEPSGSKN